MLRTPLHSSQALTAVHPLEAVSQYSGNNPFQAATAYLDRALGLGLHAGRLIPGYDCPYHATYWDSTFSSGNRSVTNPATICIFETDIGAPITRRTNPNFMQATKGSRLVVRQISTMGNYEYLYDYVSLLPHPSPLLRPRSGLDPDRYSCL